MFVQQHGRSVGKFTKKIKNYQADKNAAGIFRDAHAASKLRHGHIKEYRVCDEHAEWREHRPDPAQHGAAEARKIFAPHDSADQFPVTPGPFEGGDITLRNSGQRALKTFQVNVYGQRHGKLKPVWGEPCQCLCLYSRPAMPMRIGKQANSPVLLC